MCTSSVSLPLLFPSLSTQLKNRNRNENKSEREWEEVPNKRISILSSLYCSLWLSRQREPKVLWASTYIRDWVREHSEDGLYPVGSWSFSCSLLCVNWGHCWRMALGRQEVHYCSGTICVAKPLPSLRLQYVRQECQPRTVAVCAGLHRQGLLGFVWSQGLAKYAFPLLKQVPIFMGPYCLFLTHLATWNWWANEALPEVAGLSLRSKLTLSEHGGCT